MSRSGDRPLPKIPLVSELRGGVSAQTQAFRPNKYRYRQASVKCIGNIEAPLFCLNIKYLNFIFPDHTDA